MLSLLFLCDFNFDKSNELIDLLSSSKSKSFVKFLKLLSLVIIIFPFNGSFDNTLLCFGDSKYTVENSLIKICLIFDCKKLFLIYLLFVILFKFSYDECI